MNELLLAQAPGEAPSPFGPLVVMGLIFAFFYFLVMRPQQKKEREKETFRGNLKKNDEVVTMGGLHGRVVDLKGPIVSLELAPNVRVKIERRSIDGPVSSPARTEAKEQTK
ncbi:MAG: preprotein translocase subunit YajC [Candidatus Binatia bacterium]